MTKRAMTVLWAANLAALAAGSGYLLAPPDYWRLGQLFGALAGLTALGNAVAMGALNRPGRSAAYGIAAALGWSALPIVLSVRAGLEDRGAGAAAVGYVLVFLPQILAVALCWPIRGGLLSAAAARRPADAAAAVPGRPVVRIAAGLAFAALGAVALYAAYNVCFRADRGLAGVMAGQFLPYWGLSLLPSGGAAWGLVRGSGRARAWAPLAAAPAIAAALLCWLPVWQTPSIVAASRAAFAAAFPPAAAAAAVAGAPAPAPAGSALRSAPAPTPLNLGALFLGAPAPDVRAERGIAFLEETDADGRSYRFAADFWRPAGDGPFPVVIRVHGGAWVSGDKGAGNMGFMNRYLAGRGYAVFDIQYGLNRDAEFALKAPTPPELLGPFGIDDMVRQIGAFSAFLADNADRFAADPDRVFLSGGSAGGQLILAAALAASSGYAERRPGYGIDARLTVLGLAPFYPAVGGAAGLGISGSPELQQPIRLLSAAAPPALVYQGGLDGLVPLARVREFAAAYNAAGGGRMALIEFPTAGHGSDLEFWNCYNQVYVYFLDRFLDALAYPPSDGI